MLTLRQQREQRALQPPIRETVEALPRPDWVDRIEFEWGEDSEGEMEVFPYIIMRDGTEIVEMVDKRTRWTAVGLEAKSLRECVEDILLAKFDIFPYVRFHTVSEHEHSKRPHTVRTRKRRVAVTGRKRVAKTV